MSTNYTVTLTDTQKKSLEYVSLSNQEWIDNAVKNRCRKAKDEIININMKHCNSNGIALAVGEDAQVTQAYTLGLVKTAADREKD